MFKVLASGDVGVLGVALEFGLALLVMAYAIGPVSGCHVNPAVTFGMLLTKRIAPREAGAYVVAQVVGAIFAALAIVVIAKARQGGYDVSAGGLGANGYGEHSPGKYGLGGVALIEVLGAAFLVFTALSQLWVFILAPLAGAAVAVVLHRVLFDEETAPA